MPTAPAVTVPYVGSGPYCYANSLAMCLGDTGFSVSEIEVLTGSPFGFELLFGTIPLFDPWGWDPVIGVNAALGLLGWECSHSAATEPLDEHAEANAIDRLRRGLESGPVLAGPLEMGLLLQHPGSGQPWFSDHFVAVVAVNDDEVTFHDPHGFPYSTLPVDAFLAAWRTDTIGYADEHYGMWSDFERRSTPSVETAIDAAVAAGVAWAESGTNQPPADGTVVASSGVLVLASLVEEGLEPWQHGHLVNFAVRLGARRLSDGSSALARVERIEAAELMAEMARLVGSTHHPLVASNPRTAASRLRQLAPLYDDLPAALRTAAIG